MPRRSWMRRWVSMLAIGGLMLLLTQGSGAAEDVPATELPYQSATPTVNRSFLFYGGAYQRVDAGQGVCAGQCAVANAWTGDCTCPGGYTPLASARILIDVTGGLCGSFLYICAK
jgi:hypothetical protein